MGRSWSATSRASFSVSYWSNCHWHGNSKKLDSAVSSPVDSTVSKHRSVYTLKTRFAAHIPHWSVLPSASCAELTLRTCLSARRESICVDLWSSLPLTSHGMPIDWYNSVSFAAAMCSWLARRTYSVVIWLCQSWLAISWTSVSFINYAVEQKFTFPL